MPGVPLPPRCHLPTHEVTNQPPPLIDCNLYTTHPALTEAIDIGPGWATELLVPFGDRLASEEIATAARQANEAPPRLHSFDRFGQRIDEIEFHPAYHQLMQLGLEQGLHALPWLERPGGHTVHAALEYLLVQVEAGVCCPMTMTYAAVPALRQAPALAAEWEPKLLATAYDPRPLPLHAKRAVTCGMAMTEKQGGSDVRANQTSAVRSSEGFWLLTGHKWFCSAPMSDLFLTLAQTPAGLSCFAVPRWLPDGSRNPFYLQRLKAKLGNHANASAELEYLDTAGWLVGEEGRGVQAIIEMVHHTRLDTCVAAAGLMRQAVVQALHHASYRVVFGRPLIHQRLMQNVLADLVLESEAALLLALRVARAYDEAHQSRGTEAGDQQALLARALVAVGKYWVNRRTPALVFEALECLGGNGYVEESLMPRLYREAPLNSIWEGSGNVICLDLLRTLQRQPAVVDLLLAELRPLASSAPGRAWLADVERLLRAAAAETAGEHLARYLVERLAIGLQASLLREQAPAPLADAFVEARIGGGGGLAFGTLPTGIDVPAILTRGWPPLAEMPGF